LNLGQIFSKNADVSKKLLILQRNYISRANKFPSLKISLFFLFLQGVVAYPASEVNSNCWTRSEESYSIFLEQKTCWTNSRV